MAVFNQSFFQMISLYQSFVAGVSQKQETRFFLRNSATNLLAPYSFYTLSILIKPRSSSDNIFVSLVGNANLWQRLEKNGNLLTQRRIAMKMSHCV